MPGTLKPHRSYYTLVMQHRLTYRQIPTNLTKPLPQPISTTCNKLQGCRHHQAITYPIPMITDKSRTPCNHRHQYQGCPLIFLKSNPSVCPSSTTIEPISKPTTLAAESSKRKRHCKWRATRLRNAVTPTSPTTHRRAWAQVATAAAQVAPPSLNTRSRTQQLSVPQLTR